MAKKMMLVVLFVLLLVVAFYQNFFLEKNAVYFITEVEEVEYHISSSSYDIALDEAMRLFQTWKKTKPQYELICEHDEVDKIHAAFEEFIILISQENELALTQSALLKYYYDHIVNIDSFSFENIF